ncbi:MAG: DUF411 domain-containing protein [Gemmatimonadales bacterium]|nr:DUF411 domain-containing protein [Gemmatimonadales bacterium]
MTVRPLLLLAALAAAPGTATAQGTGRAVATAPAATMTVYKSPTCGCCAKWVDHAKAAGLKAKVVEMTDAELDETKAAMGVAPKLQSCHTAIIDGYVFEGHVPADLVLKVLKERPRIAGLAVPGMPQGSPGMETGTKDRYDVIAFEKNGTTRVFATR